MDKMSQKLGWVRSRLGREQFKSRRSGFFELGIFGWVRDLDIKFKKGRDALGRIKKLGKVEICSIILEP